MRRQRLRPLTEAEAYARCHGTRETEVRIVKIEPRRPRYLVYEGALGLPRVGLAALRIEGQLPKLR